MALTLLGSHVDCACPECRFTVTCDARDAAQATSIRCPNCDASFAVHEPPVVLSGDRVLIDRSAFELRRPERWEVVAFHRPEEAKGLTVKRVVGLPGEKVRFRNGDLVVNDRIVKKTPRQQRTMRILVHDEQWPAPNPRWQPQDLGNNWARQGGRHVHAETSGNVIDWIVYNHVTKDRDGNPHPSPVTDYAHYNLGNAQRMEDIHAMADLAISFRVGEIHGRGALWLQATDGNDEFIVQLDPRDDTFAVRRKRQATAEASGKLAGSLRDQTVEVSLIDRQFLLSVGGKVLAQLDLDASVPPPMTDKPFAIGVDGLGIIVDRLKVYRDVYYSEPAWGQDPGESAAEVGPGEFFVAGDNSPISEDSRVWTRSRLVASKYLIGKPFLVIYPTRGMSLWGRQVPVPDILRIRYIR